MSVWASVSSCAAPALGGRERDARRLVGLARRGVARLGVLRGRLGRRHRRLRGLDRRGERREVRSAAFRLQAGALVLDLGDLPLQPFQPLGIVALRTLQLAAPRGEVGERFGALAEGALGFGQRRLGGAYARADAWRCAPPGLRRRA